MSGKVLVTGSSGFVGKNVISLLYDIDITCVIKDRNQYQTTSNYVNEIENNHYHYSFNASSRHPPITGCDLQSILTTNLIMAIIVSIIQKLSYNNKKTSAPVHHRYLDVL